MSLSHATITCPSEAVLAAENSEKIVKQQQEKEEEEKSARQKETGDGVGKEEEADEGATPTPGNGDGEEEGKGDGEDDGEHRGGAVTIGVISSDWSPKFPRILLWKRIELVFC